jgi:hypothetical protein
MPEHPPYGNINSTAFHGLTGPCFCQHPEAVRLGGIPGACQWTILRTQTNNFRRYPQNHQGRYKAYRRWAELLGIWGIRVKPPKCVLEGIDTHFGPSEFGFEAGPNNCHCETCREEVARLARFADFSSDSEQDDDEEEGHAIEEHVEQVDAAAAAVDAPEEEVQPGR